MNDWLSTTAAGINIHLMRVDGTLVYKHRWIIFGQTCPNQPWSCQIYSLPNTIFCACRGLSGDHPHH